MVYILCKPYRELNSNLTITWWQKLAYLNNNGTNVESKIFMGSTELEVVQKSINFIETLEKMEAENEN